MDDDDRREIIKTTMPGWLEVTLTPLLNLCSRDAGPCIKRPMIIQSAHPLVSISRSRSQGNHLLKKTYADGKEESHIYDALGRIVQLTNPLGSFTHTYDPVNLLIRVGFHMIRVGFHISTWFPVKNFSTHSFTELTSPAPCSCGFTPSQSSRTQK
jgi:YD repeat-containing protein